MWDWQKAKAMGIGLATAWSLALGTSLAHADRLSEIQARGTLNCGVSHGLLGFSEQDGSGNWAGLDVDVCRAVATAVFGDASKVTYVPLFARERFPAVVDGTVDIVSRNTTWTLLRDSQMGVNFAAVIYYDGQGFLIRKDLGVNSALELSGATICVEAGTTTELNLIDFFNLNRMDFSAVVIDTADLTVEGYQNGRCDAYTSDRSTLAAQRAALPDPDAHVILPEVISQEPLGPAVAEGDDRWTDIVRWSVYAMMMGEVLDVSSENVDTARDNAISPEVRRFLGKEGNLGQGLGLSNDWSYQIIRQVGNYAESFERNVGPSTPLGLSRGINALWTDGGAMYPMPFR